MHTSIIDPGLMCYNQNCNGMICSAKKRQLCGTDSSTNDHCQVGNFAEIIVGAVSPADTSVNVYTSSAL